ncbi:MAG TPA: phosphopantetheine-binding protein [Pyrinomonadaceae bacterium]|nr:phosphopantetheine-binding protein [Pyrinomonadaceae bacterium]
MASLVQDILRIGENNAAEDLTRFNSSGVLKDLGRVDNQVKIKGFRIQIDEVETILRQSPDVRECAVRAREDAIGEKRLLDRKALPAPERKANSYQQQSCASKYTTAEQKLMTIWADVLKLEHVGLHDNFFDLGGDSVLGTLILARAAQAGLKFSPKQLFQHQTIAELSDVIR